MKKTVLLVFCLIASSIIGLGQTYWHASHPGSDGYNLLGYIVIDNEEIHSESLEIGTFLGDQCVGADWAPYEYGGHMFTFVTFYGTVGDVVTFKLYDHELGRVLELNCEVSATLASNGGCIGCNMIEEEYFVFRFTTPSTTQTYELEIPGYGAGNTGGYHLIASPVTEPITPTTENGFITDAFDLYYFDQNGDGGTPNNEWINYELQGGYATWKITSGKGYLYASESGTTLQFTGTACTDGDVPLVYSEQNGDHNMWGWNLIGNPLAQDASINRACYVMNTDGTELASAASGTLIPAMNGVFVKAEAEGESVTFTPSTSGSGTEVAKVVLNVLRDRAATLDRAIVCFDENSTLPKFMLDSNNTKVYIPESGEQFAVVSSARQNSLPVNFKAKENGTYTLSVDINNIEMEYLHLIDNMTGADIDLLQQPNYQFNASTSDYESRFMLAFRAETGVQEQGQESFCFVNGRSLYFCEDVEGATFNLVDMTGRMVRNESLKGNGVSLDNLSEGVYVVRLAKGNDVKTQKVVVR
jgi:hypothetical protein